MELHKTKVSKGSFGFPSVPFAKVTEFDFEVCEWQVDWASMLLAQALGQIMISPFALAVSGQQLRPFPLDM